MRSEDTSGLESVQFDWSDCCNEGRRIRWLDGEIENFSGIATYDYKQNLVAEGWMEFIETETGLEVFWWFLNGGHVYDIQDKSSNIVPLHVWETLSSKLRSDWSAYAPVTKQLP